jgi:serine/threonine protein kinase
MGAGASISEPDHKHIYEKLKSEYLEASSNTSIPSMVSDQEFELFKRFVSQVGTGQVCNDFDFSMTAPTASLAKTDPNDQINTFEEIRDVGRGAFAVAKLMRKKDSGEYCVIKIMNSSIDDLSEHERKETYNEIDIMKKLQHINIIKYQGDFVSRAVIHIVMEYADGGTLAKQIENASGKQSDGTKSTPIPFSEDRIWEWLVQIVAALEFTHTKCILHRFGFGFINMWQM